MSVLLLSLLLLLLVGLGLLATRRREHFASSPTPMNLARKPKTQVDTLGRGMDEQVGPSYKKKERRNRMPYYKKEEEEEEKEEKEEKEEEEDKRYRHRREERCPDMSEYVKLSEVPCWNCSLP